MHIAQDESVYSRMKITEIVYSGQSRLEECSPHRSCYACSYITSPIWNIETVTLTLKCSAIYIMYIVIHQHFGFEIYLFMRMFRPIVTTSHFLLSHFTYSYFVYLLAVVSGSSLNSDLMTWSLETFQMFYSTDWNAFRNGVGKQNAASILFTR